MLAVPFWRHLHRFPLWPTTRGGRGFLLGLGLKMVSIQLPWGPPGQHDHLACPPSEFDRPFLPAICSTARTSSAGKASKTFPGFDGKKTRHRYHPYTSSTTNRIPESCRFAHPASSQRKLNICLLWHGPHAQAAWLESAAETSSSRSALGAVDVNRSIDQGVGVCDTTLQGGCIHIALGPLSFGCRHHFEFSRQRISGCSACRDVRALRRLFQSRHSPLLPTALEDRASSWFIGIALVLVASVLSWSCLSVPPLFSPEKLRTAARWRQCRTSLTRTDDDGGLMMQTRGHTSFGLAQLSWSQAQAALQNSAPGHSRCTGTAALAALGFPASPTARFLHLKRTRVAGGTGWTRAPSGQRQDDVAALSSNTTANVQEPQIGPALWSRLGWGLQFSPAPHGSV